MTPPTLAADTLATGAQRAVPLEATPRAWYSLGVLLVLFVLSYIDRMALSLFVDPIKADLGLTDTGFSLLTGVAFALFYASMAIPLATYADRHGRRGVIVAGVLLWGLTTAGCGLATGFAMLFALRLGVGLGEAALTPNAWAMIPELFPPRWQGRAMALFVSGGVIGSGLALMVPNAIGRGAQELVVWLWPASEALAPWRAALLGLGVLTVLAALPALGLSRGAWLPAPRRAAGGGFGSLWARRRELAALFVGGALANAVIIGTMTWLPAYFMRVRGFTVEEAGTKIGVMFVFAGLVATLGAGWFADRFGIADSAPRGLRVIAITTLLAVPFLAAALLVPSHGVALACVAISLTLSSCMSTMLPLAVQAKAVATQRAQTAAWFLLVANLGGFGLGPSLPALVSDYGFGDPQAIGWAMLVVAAVGSGLVAAVLFRERPAEPGADR